MRRTTIAGGLILITIILVAACSGGGSNEPQAVATPIAAADADCTHRPDGSLILTEGPDVCFWPEDATVGETITVTATDWNPDEPITFYLLTEEQADISFRDLRDADKVLLGELQPSNGDVMLEFVLREAFKTSDGNELTIRSGESLQVFAWQRTAGGSQAVGAGSLAVR